MFRKELSWLLVGCLSALGGCALTVLSLSSHTRELVIDGEINRYGYPQPWLSKTLGGAVSTFGSLLQQAGAPPRIDVAAFLFDSILYTFGIAIVLFSILVLARHLWGGRNLRLRSAKVYSGHLSEVEIVENCGCVCTTKTDLTARWTRFG